METFTALWFTFGAGESVDASKLAARLEKRVRNMCEVVLSVRSRGSGVVEEVMASVSTSFSQKREKNQNSLDKHLTQADGQKESLI